MKINAVPTIQTQNEVILMRANSKDEKFSKLIESFCKLSDEQQEIILKKAVAMCQENKKVQQSHDANE